MARLVGATFLLISGRASSERGRSGGVQLREPKQEKVIPPEDRHKFIYDGEEYTRPPNLFDVGGGELKLLPEVLSDLNFEVRDFVDDGTAAEQKDLRDSRPWGRLYVDGWPSPMQYLRSHFGGPAVEGMRPLVLASPLDACEPLQNGDSAGSAVVIAVRGSCTYSTKARHAQHASASSLLIVNNEEGLVHPPGPDGKDLDIFSAMIPQAEGTALIDVIRDGEPAQGLLVPMNCKKNSGVGDSNQQCHPAVRADRELVDSLAQGGFMELPGGEAFEYLLAEFGVKVPSRELRLGSSHPSSACTPPHENDGKVVLATRGECSFIHKAEAVGAGPGQPTALIVVNNETSIFRMGASPRWRGANVSLPTLLVSDVAGRALSALPPDSAIHLTPSTSVTTAAWDDIRGLNEASAWPKEAEERFTMYRTLLSGNEGFPNRLSAVREAFSRIFGGEKGLEEGVGDRGATTFVEL